MAIIIPAARKIASAPVWLLWKFYAGLWWAFSDDPAPAPAAAQGSAFEVTDSRDSAREARAAALPQSTLRAGFIASLIISTLVAVGAHEGYARGTLHITTAWWLWGWTSALACMTSLWAVRHIARHQAATNARTWREHARASAAGFADMGRQIAGAAATTQRAAATAARQTAHAYRASRDTVRRVVKRT